ncbi:HupE/UreJ family protein [Gammaproteobacteria bacterium]|nr:HupE/UreJ family protein [Gammaproteobacteria bacterium]MDA9916945.1 HupE/UreJ family protein [Gammaproteobacteria bacterium]MDC1484364.1 HupE/UreJ family protein [Gammaproteobacteria bacterium]MDC1487472.1 HupE/UreJ family protein [Gammaproteobacteria bacterium]
MIYKKLLCCSLLIVCSIVSEAHNRSESYSKFNFTSNEQGMAIQITGSIKQDIFNNLNPTSHFQSYESLVTYLDKAINPGSSCKLNESVEINENISLGVLKFVWSYQCLQIPQSISMSLFQDLGVTHTHIARGVIDGQSVPEFMFASTQDAWVIGLPGESNVNQSSYFGYFKSGVQHILSGWDHLTFLLGLLLLFTGRFLIIAITGFTIGHSLTLGLGAMNVLRVHSEIIETLIGFSILLLAVEYFLKHAFEINKLIKNLALSFCAFLPLTIFGNLDLILIVGLALFLTFYLSLTNHYSNPWLPLMVTIFFGLIHGLGFASSIAESGIPQDRLLPIILSFNIGVEVGQLAVAFTLLAFLKLTKTYFRFSDFNYLHGAMGTFVFSMGTFWFISRAIGL